jgi:oligopeptide transport system substrate-binding protein
VDDTVYLVEIDGVKRRFHKGGANGDDYQWLLLNFDTVGVHALDERTLQVRLRHPVPYFLTLCGFYPYCVVNRACIEMYGREWTKPQNMVTNGAFRLEARRLRDRIRMVKSENYWDRENVRLNIVDAVAVESLTTALNLYLTGQVDWIEYVPNSVVPELLAQDRPDFQPSPFNTTYFYRLNVTEPPLDDARVRRALAMAINKQDIVDRILKAGQEPARSMVPMVTAERSKYRPALCEEYNVERARELLAEAGYPSGRGFPKLEVQYNTNDIHSAVAELIQSQWQQVLGVRIELKGLEWNVYQANQSSKNYQISRAGWVGDYPDPNTFLKLWISTSGQNQTGWSNTDYDALVAKAQEEPDDEKRAMYFHDAEAILMRELPIIPIYFYVSTSMSKPYVKGYYHNHQDFHPIKYIWIDDEKARQRQEARP